MDEDTKGFLSLIGMVGGFLLIVFGTMYAVTADKPSLDHSGVNLEFCQGLKHYDNENLYAACPCLLKNPEFHWKIITVAGFEKKTCEAN